jgi:small subunit ribosomal protein S3
MSRRSNTNNLRLMINKDWLSSWFCEQTQYSIFLQNDFIIYKYFYWHSYFKDSLLKMKIIRFSKKIIVFFLTSNDKDQKAKNFNLKLNAFLFRAKSMFLVFYRDKFYRNDSFYIAKKIGKLIENKVRFRSYIVKKLLNDATLTENLLIVCKGRINNVEMARKDFLIKGSIPFQKFCSKIHFSLIIANTLKGSVAIKVWSR